MKICVVGAGAIGGLLAFRLAAAGHDLSVVARGAHREAIATRGLTLVDHQNDRTDTQAMAASEEPSDFGVQDVVFIGLKVHAIPAMLPRIASLVGPHTIVVPAINGVPWWYFQRERGEHDGMVVRCVDPQGDMTKVIAAEAIIGCVVHAAGEVTQPGVVHHTKGKGFIIGEIDRGLADPITTRLSTLASSIAEAGLEATMAKDIRHDVWAKLIGNLSFNPIAALTFADMARLCSSQGLLEVIRPLLKEGMAVARGYGVHIAMTPEERIDVARRLGAARISMHQDFEAHKKPEIEAIVGAVIELAERVDVPVPVTRMIYALVRERALSDGLLDA